MFVIDWKGIDTTVDEWDGDEDTYVLTPDPDPEKLYLWVGPPKPESKPWGPDERGNYASQRIYPSKSDAMHDILDYLEMKCSAYRKRMIQVYGEIEAEHIRLKPVKRA